MRPSHSTHPQVVDGPPDAILTMTLEEALEEVLEFLARCFLVSQLGSDLPVADPFATFTVDEAIIST